MSSTSVLRIHSSPWQGLSSYSLQPDKVCHLIPFYMTGSVILSPSTRQGLSNDPHQPDKVWLSSSTWQGLTCYPCHPEKVLSFYSLHADNVCHHVPFTPVRFRCLIYCTPILSPLITRTKSIILFPFYPLQYDSMYSPHLKKKITLMQVLWVCVCLLKGF